MKTSYYILGGIIVILGLILLTPKKEPKVENTTNKATYAARNTNDPTTFTKISATEATIVTDKGNITIQLYPNEAPKTVTNFATLAASNYYNGLTFHRVEPGFVIQGGDPNGNGTGGSSVYGPKFEDELNSNTDSYKAGYKQGVVAMANSGSNTNGSQFFIMLEDNPLPNQYTIFGKVTSGMDVVSKIAAGDAIDTITVK